MVASSGTTISCSFLLCETRILIELLSSMVEEVVAAAVVCVDVDDVVAGVGVGVSAVRVDMACN